MANITTGAVNELNGVTDCGDRRPPNHMWTFTQEGKMSFFLNSTWEPLSMRSKERPASSMDYISQHAPEIPVSMDYISQHAPEIPVSMDYISQHAPEIPVSMDYISQHAPEIPASSMNYISQHAPGIPVSMDDISQHAQAPSAPPSPPHPPLPARRSGISVWSSDESRSPSPPLRPLSKQRSSRRLTWSSDESGPPSPERPTPPPSPPPHPGPARRRSRILVFPSDDSSASSPTPSTRKEGKKRKRRSHREKGSCRSSHGEKRRRRRRSRTSGEDKRIRRSSHREEKRKRRTSHREKRIHRSSHGEKRIHRSSHGGKPESSRRSAPPESKPVRRSNPDAGAGGEEEERWLDPQEADTAPAQPPFKPLNPPGPRIDTLQPWSPLQLFKLFFSTSVVRTILANTNRNAERRRDRGMKTLGNWKPLGFSEFYAFLAVIIFAGLIRPHKRSDLWRRVWPYNFRFPRDLMSCMRFDAIFWSLKMSNPDEDEENDKKKGTPAYDKLFKIKPLYNDILVSCQSLFQPAREIAIDERMVATKARIGIKQYMKNKPTRWGYKLFVLADSRCGYTWNFFVYQGKSGERAASSGHGVGFSSVMDLLDVSLLGTGYRLYIDNFYTSPVLLRELLLKNVTACGTVRATQKDFPRATRNDLTTRSAKGDMRWMRRDGLLFVKWVDTKQVRLCSSIHRAYSGETVRRKVKEAEGEWHYREIAIPDAAKDYNKHMGGVDLSDALIGCYNVLGKTMKWYKTFFYHFVDIAIVNSFILHKEMAASRGRKHLTQKCFREQLMKELADEARALAGEGEPPPPPPKVTCMPAFGRANNRKTCRKCHAEGKGWVQTAVFCRNCNVGLCLNRKRNCFTAWHDRPALRKAS